MQHQFNALPAFISRLAARYLKVQHPDPEVVRRGQVLIFLSSMLILIALIYLFYFPFYNLYTPGPMPLSDWVSTGLASSHILIFPLIIKLAKQGKSKAGSIIWLVWYGLTIAGNALPNLQQATFQEMAARFLVLCVAAGLLLGAWWSVVVAILCSVLETGIVILALPDINPDSLTGVYMRNLMISSTMWLFAGLLEQSLSESEALRREADSLRDMAIEVSSLNFSLFKRVCQQIEVPINLIVGYTNLLIRNERALSQEGRRIAEMIRHNSLKLNHIDKDTLSLSQLQSFLGSSPAVEFSPFQLLTEATAGLTQLAKRQGLHLELAIDPRLPDRCVGHPTPLRYALTRAVQGAISTTRSGTITLHARLANSDRWHISVSSADSSPAPELLVLLSRSLSQESMTSLDQLDRHTLGLLLARELILSIGGNLLVESNLTGGTIMTIDLPLTVEYPHQDRNRADT